MFKHLFFSCLLMAVLVPSSAWAAPKGEKVGTIREAHAAFKNNGSGNCAESAEWKDEAKSNTKFRQLDCFKTNNGGAVRLELNDNSSFSIAENSLVVISNLVEKDESGAFRIKLDIQKGYMGFKAEKKKGHEVNFSTGTAAASIRGTEGFIGGDDRSLFAGLKNGALYITLKNGDTLTVMEGQTAIGRDRLIVMPLSSSGDMGFAKVLNELLADTTKSLENLKVEIEKADSVYQDSVKAVKAALPPQDTVSKAQDSLQAQTGILDQGEEAKPKASSAMIKYSSYDSLRCVANVAVSGVPKDSGVSVSVLRDGSSVVEKHLKRDMLWMASLYSGVHEYEFVVSDASGQKNSVKKTLGCYPRKPFQVKVFGGLYTRLQIPPPPPGVEDVIMQTVQFQIRVPENDPSVLNSVSVKLNKVSLVNESLSQIQNLDYQIPVTLKRNKKNTVDIEVVHKSGYKVTISKVYEVGK